MAGVLLNSASVQQYTAIGDEGQPVYSVAAQLREAVRLKVGADAANCLALPRVSESRSTIDWYSPIEGMVVPWSAATDQEREQALRDLDQFHQTILQAVDKLGGVSDREKRTVQNLLPKVFHFPGRDCVFLVNGKPVLTFWGFQHGAARPPADPFHMLRPLAPAMPPPIPPGAVTDPAAQEPARRRPWWIWLLLLLLLALLLLWLLRSCVQSPATIPLDPTVSTQKVPVDPAVTTDPGLVEGAQRWWRRVMGQDRIVVPGGTDTAVNGSTLTGPGGVVSGDVTAPVDPLVPGSGANDPTRDGSPEVPGQQPEPALPEPSVPGTADPAGQTKPADPTEPPQPLKPGDTQNQPPGAPGAEKPGQSPGVTPGTDPSSPLGTPLAIPPAAMQSGSVKFLDGNWRAAGGIQDSQTGKPVRLQYQFQDGRAKVTVDRGNGVQCEGTAQSAIVGGQLRITEQGTVAKCSDGSSFKLPSISCAPDQSGRSQCTGQSPDGRALPITIRQMP